MSRKNSSERALLQQSSESNSSHRGPQQQHTASSGSSTASAVVSSSRAWFHAVSSHYIHSWDRVPLATKGALIAVIGFALATAILIGPLVSTSQSRADLDPIATPRFLPPLWTLFADVHAERNAVEKYLDDASSAIAAGNPLSTAQITALRGIVQTAQKTVDADYQRLHDAILASSTHDVQDAASTYVTNSDATRAAYIPSLVSRAPPNKANDVADRQDDVTARTLLVLANRGASMTNDALNPTWHGPTARSELSKTLWAPSYYPTGTGMKTEPRKRNVLSMDPGEIVTGSAAVSQLLSGGARGDGYYAGITPGELSWSRFSRREQRLENDDTLAGSFIGDTRLGAAHRISAISGSIGLTKRRSITSLISQMDATVMSLSAAAASPSATSSMAGGNEDNNSRVLLLRQLRADLAIAYQSLLEDIAYSAGRGSATSGQLSGATPLFVSWLTTTIATHRRSAHRSALALLARLALQNANAPGFATVHSNALLLQNRTDDAPLWTTSSATTAPTYANAPLLVLAQSFLDSWTRSELLTQWLLMPAMTPDQRQRYLMAMSRGTGDFAEATASLTKRIRSILRQALVGTPAAAAEGADETAYLLLRGNALRELESALKDFVNTQSTKAETAIRTAQSINSPYVRIIAANVSLGLAAAALGIALLAGFGFSMIRYLLVTGQLSADSAFTEQRAAAAQVATDRTMSETLYRVSEFTEHMRNFTLEPPPPPVSVMGTSVGIVELSLQRCLASLKVLAPALPPLLFPERSVKAARFITDVRRNVTLIHSRRQYIETSDLRLLARSDFEQNDANQQQDATAAGRVGMESDEEELLSVAPNGTARQDRDKHYAKGGGSVGKTSTKRSDTAVVSMPSSSLPPPLTVERILHDTRIHQEVRRATFLFVDLSSLHHLTAPEVVTLAEKMYAKIVLLVEEVVLLHGGIVHGLFADHIMAVWGLPSYSAASSSSSFGTPEQRAALCGLRLAERLTKLAKGGKLSTGGGNASGSSSTSGGSASASSASNDLLAVRLSVTSGDVTFGVFGVADHRARGGGQPTTARQGQDGLLAHTAVGYDDDEQRRFMQVYGQPIRLGMPAAAANQLHQTKVTCDTTVAEALRKAAGILRCRPIELLGGPDGPTIWEVFTLGSEAAADADFDAKMAAYERAFRMYQRRCHTEAIKLLRKYTRDYGYDRSVERIQSILSNGSA